MPKILSESATLLRSAGVLDAITLGFAAIRIAVLIRAGRPILHIAFGGYAGTNRGTELKLHLDNAGRVPVRDICAWLLSDGKRVSHTSHPLLKQSDSAVNL